jgi:outer membrane protein TolC
MKFKLLIILLLCSQGVSFAQEHIVLDSCYKWSRENYPGLKQAGIWEEVTTLQKDNIHVNSLPQISFNGQATYQSDVTGIEIPIPNVAIPQAPKDQYKAYAEIRQSFWDGGISAAGKKLEDALLQSRLSELDVELYKLHEQVSQAFFTILIAEKQREVLAAQKTVMEVRLKAAESAIKNGTAEKTSALVIRAEILNLTQNEIQLTSVRSASIQMLSLLTGKSISSDARFITDRSDDAAGSTSNRPERLLFETRRLQLDNQINLLDKNRNPKIFGFGQAGYGRPGLNMLSDKFNSYYLVGAGISWAPFDWKKTNRQKQVLQMQKDIVDTQEETFVQNLDLLLARQQEEVNKLRNIIETDREMVEIRSEVSKVVASHLENEIITTSDYIREVQSETVAKLNYELHKIQLNEALEKYNLIKGHNIIEFGFK